MCWLMCRVAARVFPGVVALRASLLAGAAQRWQGPVLPAAAFMAHMSAAVGTGAGADADGAVLRPRVEGPSATRRVRVRAWDPEWLTCDCGGRGLVQHGWALSNDPLERFP